MYGCSYVLAGALCSDVRCPLHNLRGRSPLADKAHAALGVQSVLVGGPVALVVAVGVALATAGHHVLALKGDWAAAAVLEDADATATGRSDLEPEALRSAHAPVPLVRSGDLVILNELAVFVGSLHHETVLHAGRSGFLRRFSCQTYIAARLLGAFLFYGPPFTYR